MVKKFFLSFFLFITLLFFLYLLLPAPPELFPLPESLKSTEPGDTVQIPGVSAYYTNLSRKEVIDFYRKNFRKSTFLGIPLITYILNHPPEYAKQIIRDTQQSTYFEEIVHPLRESLFVSGYEWENDPFTPPESRSQYKMVIDGKEYKCKVTIRVVNSNVFNRVLVFGGILGFLFLFLREIRIFLKSFNPRCRL